MKTSLPLALTLALALSASPALAAQSAPVTDFNGTYPLTCEDASLVLSMSLSGVIGGAAGTWSGSSEAPVDCDGVDEQELAAYIDELTASCTAGGLPYDECYELAEDIAVAVADLNDDLAAMLPVSVKMTVQQTTYWFNQLVGVYPMRGDHTAADGTVGTWSYLVNNNDGSVNGDFAALGLAFGDSGTSGNLSCGIVSAASVAGEILRAQAFALSADFFIDQSLLCSAYEGYDWLVGTVNLSYVGTVAGHKAP